MKRNIFFISDRTGITAELFGQSLLSQFEQDDFEQLTIPYIDSIEKAENARQQINDAAQLTEQRPIIFNTMVLPEIREII